jgi:non-ribosomal peptide synthetase component E (peptide arylation enzyme)
MAKMTLATPEMVAEYKKKGYWTQETIADLWDRNARDHPDKEALVDSKTRLTWSQAKQRIDRLALGFLELGLKRDEVIAVQLPNSVELCLIRLACEKAGLLYLQLSPTLRHKEVEHILKHAEVSGMVVRREFRGFDYFEMIAEIRPNLPLLRHVFIAGDGVPEGAISLEHIFQQPREENYSPDYLQGKKYPAEECSVLAATTGTTGLPKLVVYQIRGMMHVGKDRVEMFGLTGDDIVSAISPPAMGSNALAYLGAPVVTSKIMMLERFEAEEALKLIESERVTIACVVPAHLIMMVRHPNCSDYDLSSLRLVYSGGGPLPYQMALEAEDKLGCTVLQGYGSMETSGISRHSLEDQPEVRLHTAGHPVPGSEIELVDDAGKEVSQGEVGEIWVRGPTCAAGYYKDPETTKQAWTDEAWYKTGDLGKWDEQGNLVIAGRKKDMIIRGAQNIYPGEIENVLLSHPKVSDVAIVGMPDPIMGEKACACVVPQPGLEFTFGEMVSFLKGKGIASYKLPERLELMDKLPMVGEQKVDKKALQQEIIQKLKEEGKM